MVKMWRNLFSGLVGVGCALVYLWILVPISPIGLNIWDPQIYPVWVSILQLGLGVSAGIMYSAFVRKNAFDMWQDDESQTTTLLREVSLILPYIITFYVSIGYVGNFRLWIMLFPFLVAFTAVSMFWLGLLSFRDALFK